MSDIYVVLVVVFLAIIYVALKGNGKKRENGNDDNDYNKADSSRAKKEIHYHKKEFLTFNEKKFIETLSKLSNHDLLVFPQINLATVIKKESNLRYQSELYRNIDFGIFDNEYNLQLLIELNDTSHKRGDRYERDLKVRNIVSQAGIKLITFYTNKPNEPQYVISRVLKEIGKDT